MPAHSRSLQTYVLATAAAALVLLGALVAIDPPAWPSWWLVALLAVGGVAANHFPLHLGDKTKVFADTALFTAAVLVLHPAVAALLTASIVLLGQFTSRASWQQALFNPAQTAIYIGLGAGSFRAILGLAQPLGGHVALATGALAGLTVMHLLNTGVVAGMVATHLSRPVMQTWLDGLAIDLPEHIALTATGVLMAGLLLTVPWITPLLAAPVAVVYASLRTTLELRAASRELAEAAARVSDLLSATSNACRPAPARALQPVREALPRPAARVTAPGD